MAYTLKDILIPGTDDDVRAKYESLAERAKTASFGLIEPQYVVLDTETTGFNSTSDVMIEIAAAIMQGPDILERFSTFVDPGRPIPENIVELTGITDEDVKGAPDAWQAVKSLDEFIGDRQIIAHNAAFDRSFIAACCPLASSLGDEDRWIDSVELSRIALSRLSEHKLQTLSDIFGTTRSTHRAIDDVEALCALWRIMLVGLSDLPAGLPQLFAEMFPQTPWPLREVFSQVAGVTDGAKFSLKEARRVRENSQKQRQKVDAQELDGGILAGSSEQLSAKELDQAFSDSGILAQMYGHFEPRAEQLQMATELVNALNTRTHRVIEAGTGVGKSMAYLLPLSLFSQRNQVTCGVATKTNALLDQLVYHELPKLNETLPNGVSYVAVKGYDHYPCLRKLMNLTREDRVFANTASPTTVAMLLSFTCQSARGDLDPLFLNLRELARFEICASADDCLKHKCRYYQGCMLHGARRAAKKADIVITNHALLFCDMGTENGILPPIRQWVIDEAHGVEDEARKQLSFALESRTFKQALNSLAGASGVLGMMERKATPLDGASLLLAKIHEAKEEGQTLTVIAESFFSQIKELTELGEKSSYNTIELWINEHIRESGVWGTVVSTGRSVATRLSKLWTACRDVVSLSSQFEELTEIQGDLQGLTAELKGTEESLLLILDGSNTDYVYYAELDRRVDSQFDRLIAARLDIGEVLMGRLYPEMMSVIFTSATLAAGTSFEYFARSTGLDRLPMEKWQAVQLASSYDFERNMAVYLPTDIPEPNTPGYKDALAKLIFDVHVALGGSTLTLFTNRRDMEDLYARLKQDLADVNITLRCQTQGNSAKRLRDEFLSNKSVSLFALRSFWEGFDAPGDTLQCVIIPKLPFGKPNDPLMKERDLREKNAWKNYALPEAIIDLKQAAGRLIRSSTDSGALVLADSRLLSKWYGRSFLKALPSQQHYTYDTEAIAQALRLIRQY